MLEWLA